MADTIEYPMTRTVGAIGGMAWESSALYCRLINEQVTRRLGGRHSARLLVHSTDFEEVIRWHQADDRDAVRDKMITLAVELAQALVSAPRLLVLDEPTIGLDPIARDSVWQRLHQVANETGMTVPVTTHHMDEAEQHCDRIALMHEGNVHAEGTPPELKARFGVGTLDEVFRAATTERPSHRAQGGACDVHETGRPARAAS
jgi:ABC-type uncharacterized transport system ATPase subunit